MNRYKITGFVKARGTIKHVIRNENVDGAIEKFRAAHSDSEVTIITTKKLRWEDR